MTDWGERDERWAGIEQRWVDVQGTAVRVLTVDGPADGTPQVLVHGLGGSSTNWLDVLVDLSAYGPVYAPDLPGFGRTEPPTPEAARVTANVGFVHAFCGALGLPRVILYGNSMGGLIAVLLAARAPSLVHRLVLIDPGLPGPRTQMHKIEPKTLARFLPFVSQRLGAWTLQRAWDRMTPEAMLQDSLDFIYADPTRMRESYREVARENYELGTTLPWRIPSFAHATASLLWTVTLGAARVFRAVAEIEAPTLVVWGDEDILVGRPVIDGLADRRPQWTVEIMPGVGHAPMVEAPDETLALLRSWLEGTGVPRLGAGLEVATAG